jgi:hypothetical protein
LRASKSKNPRFHDQSETGSAQNSSGFCALAKPKVGTLVASAEWESARPCEVSPALARRLTVLNCQRSGSIPARLECRRDKLIVPNERQIAHGPRWLPTGFIKPAGRRATVQE